MLVWLTMIVVWGIDRALKVLIQNNFVPNESLVVIPKVFNLTYVLNPGAAFGLLAGKTWIFVLTAIIVLIGIVYAQLKAPKDQRLLRFTLGLIGGGAVGNLYDRVVIGKVVDFLDFQIWPFVFNFADAAICVGVGLLLILVYLEDRKERKVE